MRLLKVTKQQGRQTLLADSAYRIVSYNSDTKMINLSFGGLENYRIRIEMTPNEAIDLAGMLASAIAKFDGYDCELVYEKPEVK